MSRLLHASSDPAAVTISPPASGSTSVRLGLSAAAAAAAAAAHLVLVAAHPEHDAVQLLQEVRAALSRAAGRRVALRDRVEQRQLVLQVAQRVGEQVVGGVVLLGLLVGRVYCSRQGSRLSLLQQTGD